MSTEDLDPEQNHVTFHLVVDGKEIAVSGVAPARAVDSVSALWHVLCREHGLSAGDVREIYSEWEPATEDLAFCDQTFPDDAQLGYTFARPDEGGWDDALAKAARVIAASHEDTGRQ